MFKVYVLNLLLDYDFESCPLTVFTLCFGKLLYKYEA